MKVNSHPPQPLKILKILHLTQLFGMGGLERVLLNLCRGLAKQGIDSSVYVYDDEWASATLAQEARDQGIEVQLEKKPQGFSLLLVFRIIHHCREREIRLIHTHDLNALIYGVLAKVFSGGRLKVIHTQHSFVHLGRPRQRYFEKIFPRLADQIVCPSEGNRLQYENLGYRADRIEVIANGIDFDEAGAVALSRDGLPAETRELLRPHLDKIWILYLGRQYPGKGQDHWLEAWAHLNPEIRSRLCTLFLGPETDPGYAKKLRTTAQASPDAGQLVFLGETSRPLQYLKCSDIFASLSDFEGMPLAPVEAAGLDCPLILSDIPGHRGLGLPGGQVTFLAFPLAPEGRLSLEAKLRSLVLRKGEASVLTEGALEVRKRFGLKSMVGKYAAIYSRVLEFR